MDLIGIILVSILTIFSAFFLKKLHWFSLLRQIPSTKLRTFNLLGHLAAMCTGPVYEKLYPRNTYLLQILSAYGTLAKDSTHFLIWIFHIPHIILHKAESVEVLLSSTVVLNKATTYKTLHPWMGTGLLTSGAQKWKIRRKMLTPSFHFDILKDFLPVMNEKSVILNEILQKKTNLDWIDMLPVVTLCSLDIICETILGVNVHAQSDENSEYVKAVCRASRTIMLRTTDPFLFHDPIFFSTKLGRQHRIDVDILHKFTRNVIQNRKKILQENNPEDKDVTNRKRKAFIDVLLSRHLDIGDLSEEDIREEIDTFTFEGHDTTSMGLCWSFYVIGLYPDIQEAIHEELDAIFGDDDRHVTNEDLTGMKYLERVIKETQRLYPSVPMYLRQIEKDFMICGQRIPKDTHCVVLAYLLHRDEKVFPNPEVFDPDRFLPENANGRHPYAYVPFAAGPRNCIGQRFAMMELKVVLSTVLRKYKLRSLEPRDKLLPSIELVLRPSHEAKIQIIPREKL